MARKPDLLPTTRADSPRLRTVALNERDLIYSDDYVEGAWLACQDAPVLHDWR